MRRFNVELVLTYGLNMTKLEFVAPKWADNENYSLVLLNASNAERLWRSEPSNFHLYVAKWDGKPSPAWFYGDGIDGEFETAVASINEFPRKVMAANGRGVFESLSSFFRASHYLNFINGRHRTRWLLINGIPEIPICLDRESVVWAVENAVARPVSSRQLDLQFDFRSTRSA